MAISDKAPGRLFGQKPEENTGGSNADFCGRSLPDRKKSKCKGPETGWCLVCAKDSEKANATGLA